MINEDAIVSPFVDSYDGSGDDSSEYDYDDDDDDDDIESDDEQFSHLPVYADRYRLKDLKKSKGSLYKPIGVRNNTHNVSGVAADWT